MKAVTNSVLWGITLSLYAGGSGVPVPENALLIAGGYSLYQEICPPAVGILLWYAALICGDITLYLLVRWLFTRPAFSSVIDRFVIIGPPMPPGSFIRAIDFSLYCKARRPSPAFQGRAPRLEQPGSWLSDLLPGRYCGPYPPRRPPGRWPDRPW